MPKLTDDVKELQRIVRKQKKALERLTNVILVAVDDMDHAVATRRDIPRDISTFLGKWAVTISHANDATRYFVLGVDHRKDNKPKLAQKLRGQGLRQVTY